MKKVGVSFLIKTGQLLVTALVLMTGLVNNPFILKTIAVSAQEVYHQPAYTTEDSKNVLRFLASALLAAVPEPADCAIEACVALTFDDGPDNEITPKVLDTLEQAHVPATFFVIGNKVANHAAIVQREQADGYEVGNHSFSHPDFTKLSAAQINDQIIQTDNALIAAGVKPSQIFRPPYGYINQKVLQAVQRPFILWNVDPKDWHATEPESDIENVMRDAVAGSIIIMHDTHTATAAALPKLIESLKQRQLKLVTVSQLLQLQPNARGIYRGR